MEASVALYWSGNNNQIYTTLVKIHNENLVTKKIEHQENAPSRKIYTITKKGLEELHSWIRTPPELPQLKHPFLIQLTWADQLTSEELDNLLSEYEKELGGR
jgi:PadR family transcriptional regulator AphA